MKFIFLVAVALIVGCGPDPDTALQIQSPTQIKENQRFSISRVGVIEDSIAYGNKRGIYIIVDNETGQEFVGLSGVGISELGLHSSGKTSTSDER